MSDKPAPPARESRLRGTKLISPGRNRGPQLAPILRELGWLKPWVSVHHNDPESPGGRTVYCSVRSEFSTLTSDARCLCSRFLGLRCMLWVPLRGTKLFSQQRKLWVRLILFFWAPSGAVYYAIARFVRPLSAKTELTLSVSGAGFILREKHNCWTLLDGTSIRIVACPSMQAHTMFG